MLFVIVVPMLLFLVGSSIVVYRQRPWRLMEFMAVLVLGTMPGGLCVRYYADRGAQLDRDFNIVAFIAVVAIASFALVLAGAVTGLWYVDKLNVQSTGWRLALICLGVLMPVALVVGSFALYFALVNLTHQFGNLNDAIDALLVFAPCAVVGVIRGWLRYKLGLPVFAPRKTNL